MRRGTIWFGLGAALLIATYLLRPAGTGARAALVPLVPTAAGAYGLVLGLEKMIAGYRLGRRLEAAGARPRLAALACSALILLSAAAGAAAYVQRASDWRAVRAQADGSRAADRLQAITERQAAALQTAGSGAQALEAWGRSAGEALALRSDFAAALEAARHLAEHGDGEARKQAEINARFLSLYLEWMDLFSRVQETLGSESMVEPPEEWGSRQDEIIQRIQALHPPPRNGP